MITYLVVIEALDGSDVFAFTDESDVTNFIWDVQDHVLEIALSYIVE